MLAYAAAAILALIAVLHSVLGEGALLRPLFERQWQLDMPRWAAERIFRFAWHLTSVAWVGLAAAVAGFPLLHTAALVCVTSGVIVFVMLRGHLAWPMFLAAGACMWVSSGVVSLWALQGVALSGGVMALVLAGVHVYWAAGGRRGLAVAIPQRPDGTPSFSPGPLACLAVAIALCGLCGLLVWPVAADVPSIVRVGLWVALVAFVARAVGDGRQVGFSKTDRSTPFAVADDALFLPLVVALGFACAAALLL